MALPHLTIGTGWHRGQWIHPLQWASIPRELEKSRQHDKQFLWTPWITCVYAVKLFRISNRQMYMDVDFSPSPNVQNEMMWINWKCNFIQESLGIPPSWNLRPHEKRGFVYLVFGCTPFPEPGTVPGREKLLSTYLLREGKVSGLYRIL